MDYGCSSEVDPNDDRQVKWQSQRETRGFDDTELWNLDYTLAKFISPRLKAFKEYIISYPGDLTEQEWSDKLQKMIDAFEETMKDDFIENDKVKIDEGLKLFAEYFEHLWN